MTFTLKCDLLRVNTKIPHIKRITQGAVQVHNSQQCIVKILVCDIDLHGTLSNQYEMQLPVNQLHCKADYIMAFFNHSIDKKEPKQGVHSADSCRGR